MNIVLKSKKNTHYATAEYTDSRIVISKGSRINLYEAYPGMSNSIRSMRNNREIVDENGVLLQNLEFKSVSSAAVFVTGRSVNGYIAWRIDDKISLKEYYGKEKEV